MQKIYNNLFFLEHYYLDSTSPTGLRWNRDVRSGFVKSNLRFKRGDVAGSLILNKNKIPSAWATRVNGTRYLVHRVIWCMTHGEISDELVIDHVNRNPLDNRIENLRLVPQGINMQNLSLCKSNKSGITGVTRYVHKTGPLWIAIWSISNETKSKTFSVNKYGEEGAFELARNHRILQIQKLNNAGQNYTKTHGTILTL